ncbi:MAG: Holliday junction branch migration protein RuvA [Bacteroidales bacterium]|jgi:Holliday junction DNA helicase RuvA|nr:Holliday junction branch migration protein RuvA [Bacteroidales bacterium]
MITYIKGQFAEKNPAYVVVETTGGVAYLVHISLATFSEIKNLEAGELLTHYVVKEDGQTLFGFAEEDERTIFRFLISVNGIGPNTALLFLSSLSISEIKNAILNENVRLLQSVKGVGAKTAQRVIIDLKDKINKFSPQNITNKIESNYNNSKFEALSALVSLGFQKNSAESVLDKIILADGINLTSEELIKKALKTL